MNISVQILRRASMALAGLIVLAFAGVAAAEPPLRAARLGLVDGTVSFAPAGQQDWVGAVVNRPMTTGDRLWVDADSRSEMQVGGTAIRLGASTSVTWLNLDDHIAQMELAQGTLKLRVRYLAPGQTFEVDTPNLAFTVSRPGDYRIDVDATNDATAVTVRAGEAEVYGEGVSYAVRTDQGFRFYGTGLSDYDTLSTRREDDLDRWARDRDRHLETSASARYVSPEIVGYEDLDANGRWHSDPRYGDVWTPTRVAVGWTPYRDGHWAWVDPWGWTWVDDAPWGYAVSHYGRWANVDGSWCWVPGPRREQAVYAPALVAFVGSRDLQVSVSVGTAMAWFPLAPAEVYQPSYPVSRRYFDSVNRSNAVINQTTITNVYNTTIVNNTTSPTKVVYANQQVRGAVVAVPAKAFVESQPVARATVTVPQAALAAPVVRMPAVAPVQQSLHGAGPAASAKPPARTQVVVARTAPPAPPIPFAVQQKQLTAKPGAPIDDAQRSQLKPAVDAQPAPKVNVVAARAATPVAAPPATPPAGRSPAAREAARADVPKTGASQPQVAAARAGTPVAAPPATSPAARSQAAREAAGADVTKAAGASQPQPAMDAARAQATRPAASAGADTSSRADATRGAPGKEAVNNADHSRAEAAKTDAARGADSAKADAANAENERAAAAKAAAANAKAADTARTTAANAERARADAARAEAARAEATKEDAARAEAAKAAAAKAEESRSDAAKAEGARAAAAKNEAARAEAAQAQAEAAKAANARAEALKAEAARADAARVAAARAEAQRAEAARADAAQAAAQRAQAAKAEAGKAEAARADGAKAARAGQGKPPPEAKSTDEEKKKRAEEESGKRQ